MKNTRTRKWVATALLAAIIVVLQTVASGIKIGPFTPTLSLIPIIIGAILIGPVSGAVLGLVFGVIVFINVLAGTEPLSTSMFAYNPFMTGFACIFKGVMAGLVPALLFRAIAKKNETVATICAAISAPVANTGIFSLLFVTVFMPVAEEFTKIAGFESVSKLLFVGIIGTNFLFELVLNMVLIPVVQRIIKIRN